ncbi:hypothetical protein MBLNU230_g1467t1 [Neophaeotheca triangularis]
MLQIHCSGTPYEIGHTHGTEARAEISRCITFYASLFQEAAKYEWSKVQQTALEFEPIVRDKWPQYLEEMQGVADGANVALASILALNVRTEITFGLFSDGCTALSWRTPNASYLAQNWDWMERQKENLIVLTIEQVSRPTIKMVTEAGLIGKIGLNSAGVGVCLNAVKAHGMDKTRIPCHLGLRMALESESREAAVKALEGYGVASSCHYLLADASGGVGLEWSHLDYREVGMNEAKQVFHSNHYLRDHVEGVVDTNWLPDSNFRVSRIEELCGRFDGSEPRFEEVQGLFRDEANFPGGICRAESGGSDVASLFGVVMDLEARRAVVTLGRPTEPEEFVELSF